jgi:hypothetical protein
MGVQKKRGRFGQKYTLSTSAPVSAAPGKLNASKQEYRNLYLSPKEVGFNMLYPFSTTREDA